MKRSIWIIGWLALLWFATAGLAGSEYGIRARRIADHLAPTSRPSPSGDALAERPEGEELVYSDFGPAAEPGGDFHFSIGTRILYIVLLDDTRGSPEMDSFVGSIYKIEANQDYLPLRPYAQITTRSGPAEIGLGLSYDRLEIATVDNGSGDGNIEMEGWLAYLLVAYPNETRFTPFGEAGLAFYRNRFDPISSWSEDGRRKFDLDDSQAFYVGAGCDIRMRRNLFANLYLRYVNVDVDGRYYFHVAPRDFTFTLEHVACGLGLKYVF